MRFSFFPREEKFFDLFDKAAHNLRNAVVLLEEVMKSKGDHEQGMLDVGNLEHQGDLLTHDLIEKLNRSFITPFDREDIHRLACTMDDILDMVHGVADRIMLYEIKTLPSKAMTMISILRAAVEELEQAVVSLRDMKNPRRIMKSCIELNRLENEGDMLIKSAIAGMFKAKTDPLEFMKLKEIYDHLERAIDKCEDVANTIEGILVKNA